MKFLVYGKNGWIGGKVFNLLEKEGLEVVEGKCRVNKIEDIEEEIKNVQPTHIISLIGRTHGEYNGKVYGTIDYLEQPGKLVDNVRDNLFSPMVLSLLSLKYNFHFTYLGTGCIFEFDEFHPFGKEVNGFTEESKPNFFGSSYSIVKGFTDQLMHLFENNVLNIRIRMPITDEYNKRNFITKITNYEKVCSVPNSMTVLNELLPIMIDMAKNNKTGTFNLTNPGLITHNEILEMYKEIVDNNFEWKNFTIEEQNKILDSGRSNNFLDTTKLENLYPNIKNIKESVRDMLILMSQREK
jgi:nucleoside-diphosphate-sugar epimerase